MWAVQEEQNFNSDRFLLTKYTYLYHKSQRNYTKQNQDYKLLKKTLQNPNILKLKTPKTSYRNYNALWIFFRQGWEN